ncbi:MULTISPECIES: bile acid:sodium symporter family protein [Salinibaculum]|uniref:bile acid:sodium symporter family protein n=1 Tax=Salinibaculum TaxID=2732368 RepID=UPI0030CED5E3
MQAGVVDVDAVLTALTSLQGTLVAVSLVAMMAAMGTQLTQGDVRRTIRESNLVARWILANLLAVPLFAVLLGILFNLPDPSLVALLLVAIAPGAPFIPQFAALAGENSHEAVRLTAALTLVATLTVPLLVAAALTVLQIELVFPAWRFIVPLLVVLVIPLVAGALVRSRRPALANALRKRLVILANAALLVALAIVAFLDLGRTVRVFTGLAGTGILLVMALFVFASIEIGWLIGGPTAQNRRLLALGTAGRNVNIALFIATGAFPGSNADETILAFTTIMIGTSLLAALYWRRSPLTGGSPRDERKQDSETGQQ